MIYREERAPCELSTSLAGMPQSLAECSAKKEHALSRTVVLAASCRGTEESRSSEWEDRKYILFWPWNTDLHGVCDVNVGVLRDFEHGVVEHIGKQAVKVLLNRIVLIKLPAMLQEAD